MATSHGEYYGKFEHCRFFFRFDSTSRGFRLYQRGCHMEYNLYGTLLLEPDKIWFGHLFLTPKMSSRNNFLVCFTYVRPYVFVFFLWMYRSNDHKRIVSLIMPKHISRCNFCKKVIISSASYPANSLEFCFTLWDETSTSRLK